MSSPAYELVDRYLWINDAVSSIELTEDELISVSDFTNRLIADSLLNFNLITSFEQAQRIIEKIISQLDNHYLSVNLDKYLAEFVALKKAETTNKTIRNFAYYIHEFFRIAEIYYQSGFTTDNPSMRELFDSHIKQLLHQVASAENRHTKQLPPFNDPYQNLPWYQRIYFAWHPTMTSQQIQKLAQICRRTNESIIPVWHKLAVYQTSVECCSFNPREYLKELASLPFTKAMQSAAELYVESEQQKKDLEMKINLSSQQLKLAILNHLKVEAISDLLSQKAQQHFASSASTAQPLESLLSPNAPA